MDNTLYVVGTPIGNLSDMILSVISAGQSSVFICFISIGIRVIHPVVVQHTIIYEICGCNHIQ